jgi:hypothetical protein
VKFHNVDKTGPFVRQKIIGEGGGGYPKPHTGVRSELPLQWLLKHEQHILFVTKFVLLHETNKSRKILFKVGKTGPSGFRSRTIQFHQDRRQSGASPGFDRGLLLWPSDIWIEDRLEPRQRKELGWRLVDLNDENEK